MEKVLLAIDGLTPDKTAFNHAVALCLRIKAELKVLHIVRPQKMTGCLKKIKQTASQAKHYFESSMMAVTFAEAGESETADTLMSEALANLKKLLPESEKAGIPYHLTMKSGNLKEEIVSYIRENKDVIITVYDASGESGQSEREKQKVYKAVSRVLPVPVVMVQAAG